jgi:adenosylcobinamide-phosphate synthase
MVGYKNDKYINFGKASAVIDDIANYIPSRISGFIIAAVSFFSLKNGLYSLKIMMRDGNKNPSPNSGIPEAAVAGALKIRLGGINYYHNKKSVKPFIGDNINQLEIKHIKQSVVICYTAGIFTALIGVTLRYLTILFLFNKILLLLKGIVIG